MIQDLEKKTRRELIEIVQIQTEEYIKLRDVAIGLAMNGEWTDEHKKAQEGFHKLFPKAYEDF